MTVPDVLTIGRVSVDLYTEQAGVPLRDATTFRKSIGGTSTNVAVAAARLGLHAATVTKVGDDPLGDYVRHALAQTFGVDVRWVGVDPTLKTPLAFAVLDPASDPSVFFYREPRAPDQDLTVDDVDLDVVRDVAVLWIPGSCVAWEPSRATIHAVLAARARRTHTVLDLDWRPMFWPSPAVATEQLAPLLGQVTIVIGNRAECEVAVGTTDPHDAADRLLAHGLDAALVKLGADGVLVALADGTRDLVAPFEIELVCGLGSGDAFGGALCHALVRGLGVAEGARRGNAAGAFVAGRMMCADDMPYPRDIESLLLTQRPGGTPT